MKRLYYNINSPVWVKLTPLGHELHRKFWIEALKGSSIENAIPVLATDDEGWTKFNEMWDVMSIFGCHLYNGCKSPFATNIRFSAKDFTKVDPTKK